MKRYAMPNELRKLFEGNETLFERLRKLIDQLVIPEATATAYYANSLLDSENRSAGQSASCQISLNGGKKLDLGTRPRHAENQPRL